MTECTLTVEGGLAGRVGFDNLAEVREAGETRIRGFEGECIEFDCSGLEEASSVAVALLIAWQRAARAIGKSVVFRGASASLRNIAAFSGLSDILALDA